MILNEDYFNDLKLKDDDLELTDDVLNSSGDNIEDAEQYIDNLTSSYSNYIVLEVKKKDIIYADYVWESKVPYILKNIRYVFNTYGIEYSEPVLQDRFESAVRKDYSYIVDFHGYKLLSKYKTIENNTNVNRMFLYVGIYFNLPEVHSYTSACKFVSIIMKSIWKNMFCGQYINRFFIFDLKHMKEFYASPFSQTDYLNLIIYMHDYVLKSLRDTNGKIVKKEIVEIIKLFFPEKRTNDLTMELKDDYETMYKPLTSYFH